MLKLAKMVKNTAVVNLVESLLSHRMFKMISTRSAIGGKNGLPQRPIAGTAAL